MEQQDVINLLKEKSNEIQDKAYIANASLKLLEGRVGFIEVLLSLAGNPKIDHDIRLNAAVYLQQLVFKSWGSGTKGSDFVHISEKEQDIIRNQLVKVAIFADSSLRD